MDGSIPDGALAPRTLVAILAAGRSARMGFPKLFTPYPDGHGGQTCLLERACTEALASRAARVAVVGGAYLSQARAIVKGCADDDARLVLLENDVWETGQASSVRLAASHASEQGFDALLVMAADQPFVCARHLDALVAAFETRVWQAGPGKTGRPWALRTSSAGRLGNPCLFPRAAFDLLATLEGDEGARQLFRAGALACEPVEMPNDADTANGPVRDLFCDLDTPEEFARFSSLAGQNPTRLKPPPGKPAATITCL